MWASSVDGSWRNFLLLLLLLLSPLASLADTVNTDSPSLLIPDDDYYAVPLAVIPPQQTPYPTPHSSVDAFQHQHQVRRGLLDGLLGPVLGAVQDAPNNLNSALGLSLQNILPLNLGLNAGPGLSAQVALDSNDPNRPFKLGLDLLSLVNFPPSSGTTGQTGSTTGQPTGSNTGQPQTTTGNTGQPQTTPGNTGQPQTTPGNTGQPQTTPGNTGQPQTTPGNTEQPQTPPGNTEQPQTPPGNTEQPQIPPGNTEQPQTPPGNTEQLQTPPGNTEQLQTPPGNTEQPQTPPGNTEQLQTPPGNTEQLQTPPGNTEQPQTLPGNTEQPQTPPSNTEQLQTPPGNTEQPQISPGNTSNNENPTEQPTRGNSSPENTGQTENTAGQTGTKGDGDKTQNTQPEATPLETANPTPTEAQTQTLPKPKVDQITNTRSDSEAIANQESISNINSSVAAFFSSQAEQSARETADLPSRTASEPISTARPTSVSPNLPETIRNSANPPDCTSISCVEFQLVLYANYADLITSRGNSVDLDQALFNGIRAALAGTFGNYELNSIYVNSIHHQFHERFNITLNYEQKQYDESEVSQYGSLDRNRDLCFIDVQIAPDMKQSNPRRVLYRLQNYVTKVFSPASASSFSLGVYDNRIDKSWVMFYHQITDSDSPTGPNSLRKHHNNTGLWIGLGVGLGALIYLVAVAYWIHRHHATQRSLIDRTFVPA